MRLTILCLIALSFGCGTNTKFEAGKQTITQVELNTGPNSKMMAPAPGKSMNSTSR
jgi:hypothetical protein